jgi:hypothetical protein
MGAGSTSPISQRSAGMARHAEQRRIAKAIMLAALGRDQGRVVGCQRAAAHEVALVRGQGEQACPALVAQRSPSCHPAPPCASRDGGGSPSAKRRVDCHDEDGHVASVWEHHLGWSQPA